MARKFGKVNHVSANPLNCSVIFMGSPKIGKTSIMNEIYRKLVGPDGYMFLEMYRESGADMIEGCPAEKIETWNKLDEVICYIEDTRDTDCKELKVVLFDTWDNAILLAEKEALRLWNRTHPDQKTDNISAAYGGFQRGQEKAAELLDEMKSRLEAIGIKVVIIMHIKNSTISDPVSEKTYSQVTADVSQKYFNRIKRNADVIAVAYVDREIITEKTGKKNLVTGQDITRDVVSSEARKIKFRDSGYAIDAGGRLKYIVEEIPFDADAYIKAITDALEAEITNAGISLDDRKAEDAKNEAIEEEEAVKTASSVKKNRSDEDRNVELISIIKEKFPNATDETKASVKQTMSEYGINNFKDTAVSTEGLEKIVDLLK